MNEQTVVLIEQLANKLGTTSEYLWGVLIHQAPVDATITLIQIIISIILSIILYKAHIKLSKRKDYGGYNKENGYHHYQEIAAIPMFLFGIFVMMLLIISFFNIDIVINGYFNPEYWALNKVLNIIK